MTDNRPIESLSDEQVFSQYSAAKNELKRRGLSRTNNPPTGDYAEHLVHRAYGGTRLGASGKAADIELDEGQRIEVKGAVLYRGRRIEFSPFRTITSDDGNKPFTFAVFVVFEPDAYRVVEAWQVPIEAVASESAYVQHVNGYRLTLTGVRNASGAEPVTEKLQRAQPAGTVTRPA